MVIFRLLLRKFRIQTWFCNCQQYLCLFYIVFEYIPGFHDQGKMLVLQINFFVCGGVLFGQESCSAEVRGLVIHDIKEVEGVKQQEEQEDKRDN